MYFESLSAAERRGIVAGFAAFVIGIVLAEIISFAKMGDSATFIALLLIPLFVYAIASGKVQEFSAPGGWGAKFRDAATEKVRPSPLTDCIQDLQVVEKGGLEALQNAGHAVDRGKPVALTLQLGRQGYYQRSAVRMYIETLRITDPQMTVLFLDRERRFVVMAEATAVLGLLKEPQQSQPPEQQDRLIRAIESNDVAFLRSLPGFHWQTITSERTNAEALQLMREANARAMVVVDSEQRPIGVVKRDDIMARLLVELAGSHKA